MSYFARKLRYGAHDADEGANYLALVELARRKGGRPVEFVLYRRIIQYHNPAESHVEMIRVKATSAEEAVRRFWPLGGGGTGKEFPGHKSQNWVRTTLWLDLVAAGGGYERFGYENTNENVRPGIWVKVGRPASWSKRRKKKPLRFGNLAHILLVRMSVMRSLEDTKSDLEHQLSGIEMFDDESECYFSPEEGGPGYLAYYHLKKEIARIAEEIESVRVSIKATKAEMRHKVRQIFPLTIGRTPKRALRSNKW